MQIWISSELFFVFKQKTADEMRISDWSSDVCSSDLAGRNDRARRVRAERRPALAGIGAEDHAKLARPDGRERNSGRDVRHFECRERLPGLSDARLQTSEKRRAGKECVSTCIPRCTPDL